MEQIVQYIDHTLLKADATKADIMNLCREAKLYHFKAVCVNPIWVRLCKEELKEAQDIEVCTVIGFPLGANTIESKVFEAKEAIGHGATEIDLVLNIGALKDQNDRLVVEEIQKIVSLAQEKAMVKVIIETSLLTDEEKVRAATLIKETGADFVKTSTGFSTGGATIEDIVLLKKTVGNHVSIKASGGIKDYQTAKKFIEAGASRIGTSSGVSIASNA